MQTLELLHFNDVYHVSPNKDEPIGGASRFETAIQAARQESSANPLLLFSGDAFNPSLEGSITRGKHMTEVLNRYDIAAACLGNHDFDFGLPQLHKLLSETTFPWLLSNVLFEATGQPPELVQRHLVIDHVESGLRLGIIGLVEKFPPELVYHDFVQVAKELSQVLRDPEGPHKVDLVIALTHMRVPNDVKLAKNCLDEVDLVLGGHDHFFYISKSIQIVGDHWTREENLSGAGFDPEADPSLPPLRIVKSGTDFREFSALKFAVDTDETGKKYIAEATAERRIVDSSVAPDPAMDQVVEKVAELVASKTKRAIGYTTVPLDGRSTAVRAGETNLGDLTADLMLWSHRYLDPPCELALCVGGTIRNDSIFEVGQLTLGDIMVAFPFQDPIVVLRLTGQEIWDALENSVSEYPKQEGRFPQLAGMRLEWNPERPPGERVRRVYVLETYHVQGSPTGRDGIMPRQEDVADQYNPENMIPLDLEREYVVATRAYLAQGYDGFQALKVGPERYVLDEENGVLVSTLYRRFFLGLKYLNAFREFIIKHRHNNEEEERKKKERIQNLVATAANHWRHLATKFETHYDDPEKDSHHTTETNMVQVFDNAVQGHPTCLVTEDEEDEQSEPEALYPDESQDPWIKRWASIGPGIQGRIVRVED
ncbi:hypothetical protein DFQ28_003804 [Apophysomyces sp. BC1034]|nr:hypothetical protein DFQ30_000209 [Apophysomyces sp. BC1015]KAG0178761.1 hypothetical protein DFQ29_003038 [Apophysomyces sp. BC1021]KAG0189141.1 hypothetical protein DFQ28_003804 [Apophysomyces sp. BC1034]